MSDTSGNATTLDPSTALDLIDLSSDSASLPITDGGVATSPASSSNTTLIVVLVALAAVLLIADR